MTSFRWARKAACGWLSLLTAADRKWIPQQPGTLLPVAYSPPFRLQPRFPEPTVLARLDLGALAFGGRHEPALGSERT